MTYRVLKPIYEKTGETTTDSEGRVIFWQRVAGWEDIGQAANMRDALAKYPRCKANGYSPVLQFVGRLH